MIKVLFLLLFFLSGCAALKDTIAVGACGKVDYRVTFMGTPLIGVQADRECNPEEEDD